MSETETVRFSIRIKLSMKTTPLAPFIHDDSNPVWDYEERLIVRRSKANRFKTAPEMNIESKHCIL